MYEGEAQDPDQQHQLKKSGAMMMDIAATSAIKVIGPWLNANTESHSVALFFSGPSC